MFPVPTNDCLLMREDAMQLAIDETSAANCTRAGETEAMCCARYSSKPMGGLSNRSWKANDQHAHHKRPEAPLVYPEEVGDTLLPALTPSEICTLRLAHARSLS